MQQTTAERKTAVTNIARTGMFRPAFVSRPWGFVSTLLYILSIPERAVRSLVAWLGGVVLGAARILPRPIRRSRFYRVAVLKMLQVVVDGIGQAGIFEAEEKKPEGDYMPRKIIGSVIDNASIALFHISPIWILLLLSDVLHGSRIYLSEVTAELKKAGVIDPKSTIDNVDSLLNAISSFSGDVAESLDTPPISVDQMRTTLGELRTKSSEIDLRTLVPEEEMNRLAVELKQVAAKEKKSLLQLSAGLTTYVVGRAAKGAYGAGLGVFKGVEVGARLAWREVISDYIEGLDRVRKDGLDVVIAEGVAPYVKATANNFHPQIVTGTEILFSFGRYKRAPWRLAVKRGRLTEAIETGSVPS